MVTSPELTVQNSESALINEGKEIQQFFDTPENISELGQELEASNAEICSGLADMIPTELIPQLDDHFIKTMRG